MTVLLRDHMLSLKRIGARLTAAQGNALVPATTALVAACLNAAAEDAPGGEAAVALASMVTARRLIDASLSDAGLRSEEHTSELQSLMRISYAVFCLKKKKHITTPQLTTHSESH